MATINVKNGDSVVYVFLLVFVIGESFVHEVPEVGRFPNPLGPANQCF